MKEKMKELRDLFVKGKMLRVLSNEFLHEVVADLMKEYNTEFDETADIVFDHSTISEDDTVYDFEKFREDFEAMLEYYFEKIKKK